MGGKEELVAKFAKLSGWMPPPNADPNPGGSCTAAFPAAYAVPYIANAAPSAASVAIGAIVLTFFFFPVTKRRRKHQVFRRNEKWEVDFNHTRHSKVPSTIDDPAVIFLC